MLYAAMTIGDPRSESSEAWEENSVCICVKTAVKRAGQAAAGKVSTGTARNLIAVSDKK